MAHAQEMLVAISRAPMTGMYLMRLTWAPAAGEEGMTGVSTKGL